MNKLVLTLGILVLSACTFQQMDKGLSYLQGQNIETAINYLGYPDNKQKILNDTVYTWGTNYNVSGTTPVTNYHYGSANAYNTFGGSAFGTYSGTSTTYVPTTFNYRCTLKIVTDEKGTIINSQYDGNQGGCSDYGQALAEYSRAVETILNDAKKRN